MILSRLFFVNRSANSSCEILDDIMILSRTDSDRTGGSLLDYNAVDLVIGAYQGRAPNEYSTISERNGNVSWII